jgi:hypothetical protein
MPVTIRGSGQVPVQIISVTKTDTFTLSGGSAVFTDVTGLAASITPSSASNKILCLVNVALFPTTNNEGSCQLIRGSTVIGGGTATGSRPSVIGFSQFFNGQGIGPVMISFLDSPATTSSTTYKVAINGVTTTYVNRTANDADTAYYGRTSSTITLMEISG